MNHHLRYLLILFYFINSWIQIQSAFIDTVQYRCDYRYFKNYRGWFKYHSRPAAFQDARLRCEFEGAILASPTTSDIKKIMSRSIESVPIFTGIHATFSPGDYTTIDGIKLAEIEQDWVKSKWANNTLAEDCVSLDTEGLLANVACDEPRPFICFRDKVEEINVCGTPDAEYLLNNETNSCYKFHTVPRPFNRAYMACSAEGGHLVIINGEKEVKAINDLFQKYPPEKMLGKIPKDIALVGIHDWNEHGDWRTIHAQTLTHAGYDKFSPDEANDNNSTSKYCATVMRSSGLLREVSCDDSYPFICEKKPDFPPLCSIH